MTPVEQRMFVIQMLGLTMAFDFSIYLPTLQSMWMDLGGPAWLYGTLFGCYDLASVLVGPFFGYWSDKRGLKEVIIVCTLLNGIGNLCYALAVFCGRSWALMLIGRTLAGAGSSAMAQGLIYIAATTAAGGDRKAAIAKYKLYQGLARICGPMIGYILLPIPNAEADSPMGLQLFNSFTLPGWAAAANSLLLQIPLQYYLFQNPPKKEKLIKHANSDDDDDDVFTWYGALPLVKHVALICLIQMSSSYVYWSLGSNLFIVALAEFHVLQSSTDLWKVYIGGSLFYILFFAFYGEVSGALRPLSKLFKFQLSERYRIESIRFLSIGCLCFAMGYAMLIIWYASPFWGDLSDVVPHYMLFYMGMGVAAGGTAFFFPAIDTLSTSKVTQYADFAGPHQGLFISMFTAFGSVGRFAGPAVTGVFLDVVPLTALAVCTPSNPDNYHPEGCGLRNANRIFFSHGVLALVYIVLQQIYIHYHGDTSVKQYRHRANDDELGGNDIENNNNNNINIDNNNNNKINNNKVNNKNNIDNAFNINNINGFNNGFNGFNERPSFEAALPELSVSSSSVGSSHHRLSGGGGGGGGNEDDYYGNVEYALLKDDAPLPPPPPAVNPRSLPSPLLPSQALSRQVSFSQQQQPPPSRVSINRPISSPGQQAEFG